MTLFLLSLTLSIPTPPHHLMQATLSVDIAESGIMVRGGGMGEMGRGEMGRREGRDGEEGGERWGGGRGGGRGEMGRRERRDGEEGGCSIRYPSWIYETALYIN